MSHELLLCPGECGSHVHASAKECPKCGYRGEHSHLDELLSSLSTIASIMVGFSLAAVVGLVIEGEKQLESKGFFVVLATWLLASILLLFSLVGVELLRRQADFSNRLQLSPSEFRKFEAKISTMLNLFVFGLIGILLGLLILGFYVSTNLGVFALVVCGVALFRLIKVFR
jgi:hypothetical protein